MSFLHCLYKFPSYSSQINFPNQRMNLYLSLLDQCSSVLPVTKKLGMFAYHGLIKAANNCSSGKVLSKTTGSKADGSILDK